MRNNIRSGIRHPDFFVSGLSDETYEIVWKALPSIGFYGVIADYDPIATDTVSVTCAAHIPEIIIGKIGEDLNKILLKSKTKI